MSSQPSTIISKIRLLAVMEAKTVTGAAKNMLDFCQAARELEGKLEGLPTIETSIVTFERGREGARSVEAPNEFVAAARAFGLEVDVIPERMRFDMSVIPALREIAVRRAPDIVLTHHVKSHFIMKRSRLWQQFPWVAFHHGYTTTYRRERLYNLMDRLSLPSARRVVTVCDAFARELISVRRVPRERIHVQHNSIRQGKTASAEEVLAFREKLAIEEGERIILSIGRLSSEKAHIDLLRAFRHLRDVHAEIKARLVIVGDGPERGRLQDSAKALGIDPNVYFAGQMSDVRACYAGADVLALPSHSEGSPYVLLEAMAANLPVVATSVGGVPELVEDEESALLVPARDTRAMAGAIARVLIDGELARRLAANASRLVATRYSPETYVRSLVEIYREIIESGAWAKP